MARRWTSHDDQVLLELYRAGLAREAIGRELGRSPDSIDARRRLLSQPARTTRPRPWTPGEDAFVRAAAAAGVPGGEVARRLNRTAHAVRRRRELLGATARPRPPRYRPEEDAALGAAVASGEPLAPLAERLGRTEAALRLRARSLGLIAVSGRRRWTPDEDERLRAAYAGGLSTARIAELLPQRSSGAIVARAHLLGLAEHGRRWTPPEDRMLRTLVALGLSATAVGMRLGRTEEAVGKRCRRLGVPAPSPDPPARQGPWSPLEDELLRERAGEPVARLVATFARSAASIRRRRRQLGLEPADRTQHHPLAQGVATHARRRAIVEELPLTPARALAVARRLDVPLAELRRVARASGHA